MVSAAARLPSFKASAAVTVDPERAALARRMKADWCGFGAAEHARQTQAVIDKASANNGLVGTEAIGEMRSTVGAEVLEEATEQVRQRWIQALVQRGDVRSLALADFLGVGSAASAEQVTARTRLIARARTSSDPMVTALALQRACGPGRCAGIEASQWSRLEPANLQAWLYLLQGSGGATLQTQVDYVLERIATAARYSNGYQGEFREALLSLPQTQTQGLQAEAEISLVNGLVSAWPVPSYSPITAACRTNLADATRAARCEALAALLWQQGDLLNRYLGVGIARQLIAARPALRPQWESQAREYEAVQEWMQAASLRALNRLMPDGEHPASPCLMQPELRNMLRQSVDRTEWERIRADMKEAGEDEAVLAARWRQAAERSALDPLPPPRSASSPKAG